MIREIILKDKKISYDLERKKVKNVNLRIRRDGSIAVSASKNVPVAFIEAFMQNRADFILSALKRHEKRLQNTAAEPEYKDGDLVRILGRDRRIALITAKKNEVIFDFATDSETLLLTLKDKYDDELRKKTFEKWQKTTCKEIVTGLCEKVYSEYPIFEEHTPFPTLHFKTMRTRWGSCNSKGGSLNFNYALIQKPLRCIEYVVMHEFVHFLHPDHSKDFYSELSFLMPDWKERKNELNAQDISNDVANIH